MNKHTLQFLIFLILLGTIFGCHRNTLSNPEASTSRSTHPDCQSLSAAFTGDKQLLALRTQELQYSCEIGMKALKGDFPPSTLLIKNGTYAGEFGPGGKTAQLMVLQYWLGNLDKIPPNFIKTGLKELIGFVHTPPIIKDDLLKLAGMLIVEGRGHETNIDLSFVQQNVQLHERRTGFEYFVEKYETPEGSFRQDISAIRPKADVSKWEKALLNATLGHFAATNMTDFSDELKSQWFSYLAPEKVRTSTDVHKITSETPLLEKLQFLRKVSALRFMLDNWNGDHSTILTGNPAKESEFRSWRVVEDMFENYWEIYSQRHNESFSALFAMNQLTEIQAESFFEITLDGHSKIKKLVGRLDGLLSQSNTNFLNRWIIEWHNFIADNLCFGKSDCEPRHWPILAASQYFKKFPLDMEIPLNPLQSNFQATAFSDALSGLTEINLALHHEDFWNCSNNNAGVYGGPCSPLKAIYTQITEPILRTIDEAPISSHYMGNTSMMALFASYDLAKITLQYKGNHIYSNNLMSKIVSIINGSPDTPSNTIDKMLPDSQGNLNWVGEYICNHANKLTLDHLVDGTYRGVFGSKNNLSHFSTEDHFDSLARSIYGFTNTMFIYGSEEYNTDDYMHWVAEPFIEDENQCNQGTETQYIASKLYEGVVEKFQGNDSVAAKNSHKKGGQFLDQPISDFLNSSN